MRLHGLHGEATVWSNNYLIKTMIRHYSLMKGPDSEVAQHNYSDNEPQDRGEGEHWWHCDVHHTGLLQGDPDWAHCMGALWNQ